MKIIKYILEGLLIIALFSAAGFMAPLEAHGATLELETPIALPVPIGGHTRDGKYPLYLLRGGINDEKWTSTENVVYNANDLVKAGVVFVDKDDIKKYTCGVVCIDKAKNIVGLNPKFFYFRSDK